MCTPGLEHEIVTDVVESLKIITRRASIRIAEAAFKYASDGPKACDRRPQSEHHETQ